MSHLVAGYVFVLPGLPQKVAVLPVMSKGTLNTYNTDLIQTFSIYNWNVSRTLLLYPLSTSYFLGFNLISNISKISNQSKHMGIS